ncbi:uncharacterized protein Bfra_001130 [Botrytis fragariae]|uniref:Uncharacterized protein n=1 Tax=Botrytis fragariae TaxID=1964551 RepID=A0A8H6ENQ9_9HELO|nr:uncharacterized protein Bfra_001130 [Botrytis fragariae]KAF5878957.1 hypothetical protein Bfra_001130 [Botrytis fragariae]
MYTGYKVKKCALNLIPTAISCIGGLITEAGRCKKWYRLKTYEKNNRDPFEKYDSKSICFWYFLGPYLVLGPAIAISVQEPREKERRFPNLQRDVDYPIRL